MSEETKTRTVADIQQEYQQSCLRAGHLQYQIDALSKDLSLLNSTMRDLNLEAADLKAKETTQAAPEGASNV
jgi:hypothetical protein